MIIIRHKECISLPYDWFEEIVYNTDKACRMNNETSFQILLIPSIYHLKII